MPSFDFDVVRIRGLWVSVVVTDLETEEWFYVEGKVYSEPDGFGADYNGYGVREGSRISKMSVRRSNKPALEIFAWDRGPSIAPIFASERAVVSAAIDFLEETPRMS